MLLLIFPLAACASTRGRVPSIRKGPRVCVIVQFPTLSRVRKWKYHFPFARVELVVCAADSSRSLALSGALVARWFQENENPSTPEPSSSELKNARMVRSPDQPFA